MKNINILKASLAIVLIASTFTNCVQDDDFSAPPIICEDTWTTNTDLATVKALNSTSSPILIEEDLIFDGYVVSTDEFGNFFKTVTIQNATSNPTAGLQIELDNTGLYGTLPLGTRVLVSAEGLYIAKDRGTTKLGGVFTDSNGSLRLGRLDAVDIPNQVRKACGDIAEIIPTEFDDINEALEEANINTLIKLNNVQFTDADGASTFYDPANVIGGATNQFIEDQAGNSLAIRTSSYADFAGALLPDGSGSVTLVLRAYDINGILSNSDYQGYIRSIDDVNLDGTRILTTIPYVQEFNNDLPSDWVTYNVTGERSWEVREYDNVNYAQNGAFSNGDIIDMESWLITNSFDFDAQDNEEMILTIADAFSNGNPLKVYYSTDYSGSGDPTSASWTQIGEDEINALNVNTGQYDNVYEATSPIDLSGINGIGFIAFVYDSEGATISTTVQMSSVTIQ